MAEEECAKDGLQLVMVGHVMYNFSFIKQSVVLHDPLYFSFSCVAFCKTKKNDKILLLGGGSGLSSFQGGIEW